jgi:hypothetical protein
MSALIGMTLSNGEEEMQLLFGAFNYKVKYWGRKTPAAGAKVHWSTGNLSEAFWAGSGTTERMTTVHTMRGWINSKIKKIEGQPLVLKGVYEVKLTQKDIEELGLSASPNSLFTRVNKAFKEPPVRKVEFNSAEEAAAWITDGPLLALGEENPLDPWTQSPLAVRPSTSTAITLPEPDEDRLKGIVLTDDGDTTFFPYVFWEEKGLSLTQIEFLRACYPETGKPRTVALVGPPGTGKTNSIWAAFLDRYKRAGVDFQRQCVITGSASTTAYDIVGSTWENPKTGRVEFRPGKLIFCMENGVPLFIDESNRIPSEELAVVLPALDDRRILPLPDEYDYAGGAVHAKPGFGIVFAFNPGFHSQWSSAINSRVDYKARYHTNWELLRTITATVLDQTRTDQVLTWFRQMDTIRQEGGMEWSPQFREGIKLLDSVKFFGSLELAISALLEKFELASDRDTAETSLDKVMEVSVRPFIM